MKVMLKGLSENEHNEIYDHRPRLDPPQRTRFERWLCYIYYRLRTIYVIIEVCS